MGGYGTPIGETKSYKVYLHVNCSSEHDKFFFKIYRKSDDVDIDFSEWCSEEENPDMKKFAEELEHDYIVFYIKDKGLRDKVEFEKRYQELEKENIRLKEQVASLKVRIENARKIIGG